MYKFDLKNFKLWDMVVVLENIQRWCICVMEPILEESNKLSLFYT